MIRVDLSEFGFNIDWISPGTQLAPDRYGGPGAVFPSSFILLSGPE